MPAQIISVTHPVGQALERVKVVLFRPFDAAKWFTIGFCAWLATLGRQRGVNFNTGFHDSGKVDADRIRETIWHVRDYVVTHLYWIIPVAAVLLAFFLAVWVCVTWLNSRGAFMFLHCVACNRSAVAEPWRQYRREGNSLFAFRLGLGLLSMAVTLPGVILAAGLLLRMFLADAWDTGGILRALGLGLAGAGWIMLVGLVRKLTNDFTVPVMYRRRAGWRDGWKAVLHLLSTYPGEILVYLLFQIVLAVIIAMLVIAVVIATCCLAGCIMALPYLGTVLLLPVLVFSRSYSLYYLAQFGADWDAFLPAEPPVGGSAGPSAPPSAVAPASPSAP